MKYFNSLRYETDLRTFRKKFAKHRKVMLEEILIRSHAVGFSNINLVHIHFFLGRIQKRSCIKICMFFLFSFFVDELLFWHMFPILGLSSGYPH